MWRFICELSITFHLSICLSIFQYHLLDYSTFVLVFKCKIWLLQLFSFFLKTVGYFLDPFISIWIFGSSCQFPQKVTYSAIIFIRIVMNLQYVHQFGEYCHLNNIKIYGPWIKHAFHLWESSLTSATFCSFQCVILAHPWLYLFLNSLTLF